MGICVKIEVADDGKISVGTEPYEEEAAEQQPAGGAQDAQGGDQAGAGGEGGADQGDQMTPARSVDEALAMAKQLLDQATNGGAQAQEQAGFEGGFAQQAPQSIANLMK